MEWQFTAPRAVSALSSRRKFLEFLRMSCTAESDYLSAEIVYGELVANVVRHAPGPIEITARSDTHGLVSLDVCDTGPAFSISDVLPEALYSVSGRGLFIVSRLCAHLSATHTASGNKVHVVLPVIAKASPLRVVRDQCTRSEGEVQSIDDEPSEAAK